MGAKFYYQTIKIGVKLATKLSPKTRTLSFPKIWTASGDLTQKLICIMKSFQDFYSKLYTDGYPPSPYKIDYFLQDIPLPKIMDSQKGTPRQALLFRKGLGGDKNCLNRAQPWAQTVFQVAITKNLALYMTHFFNSLLDGAPLDKDLNTAFISVIPNPGKDTREVG